MPDGFTLASEVVPNKVIKDATYIELVNTPQARAITLPLWLIWGLFGFTYYAVVLFIARMYSNQDHLHDNRSSNDGAQQQQQQHCEFDYAALFFNAASETVALLISAQLIDRLGRVRSQSAFYALGGIAVVLLGTQPSAPWMFFLAVLARMSAMSSSVS